MKLIQSGTIGGLKQLRTVRLVPETAEEAGILAWLAQRYQGDVRFFFDTSSHGDAKTYPMLWIGELEKEP